MSEVCKEDTPFTRRSLFSILPARTIGCFACAHAITCAQPAPPAPEVHTWSEKADVTWEEMFRFAYQKDVIPLLKELAAQVGRARFVEMLRTAGHEVVRKKTSGRPVAVKDVTALAAGMKNIPPVIQHALTAEVVEQSAEAFEYRVTKCLWAKVFRDADAGDIGYAMVCYPDYAVAKGLNPKLQLVRTKTLMQGDDACNLRYIMTA